MFGGGWTEMLIIGIVALVVIGPKDLPVVMRKLGRMVSSVRRMGDEFQRELNKTTGLDQIVDLKRQITEPLRQSSDEIMREFNKITTSGVEPSGAIKPPDPAVESVYDQIAATSGITPDTAAPPVMKPLSGAEANPTKTAVGDAGAKAASGKKVGSRAKSAEKPPSPKRTSKATATSAAIASPAPVPAVSASAAKAAAPRARAQKPAVKAPAATMPMPVAAANGAAAPTKPRANPPRKVAATPRIAESTPKARPATSRARAEKA